MNELTQCPVCNSTNFEPFLVCRDHTVSGEQFKIVSCKFCEFKFTNPRPEDNRLGEYYKSDEYISHSNTKKGLVARLYHLVRNYTLNKKESLVSGYVSRGTVLDYGSGTGMFLNTCKSKGWSCFGMEPDPGARKMGQSMDLKIEADLNSLSKSLSGTKLDAIT